MKKSVGDILNPDSSDFLWNACAVQGQRRNDHHEWVFLSASLLPLLSSPPNVFFWKSWWYVAHPSGRGDRRATLPPRNLKRKPRPYRIRFICSGLARAGKSARRSHEPVALLLRILTALYASLSRFHCIVGAARAGLFFHQRSFASTCKIWVVQALKLFSTSSTDRESGNILPFALVPEKVWRRAPRANLLLSRGLAPLSSSTPDRSRELPNGGMLHGVRWVRGPVHFLAESNTHAAAATRLWNRLDCFSISLAITLSCLLPTLRVARIRYNWFHRYCR